jgi:regulatory protein
MNEKEALQKVEAYCTTGEHCESEVREKMKRMELLPDVVERIIRSLEDNRFIDDRRYAGAYAHDKMRFSKWGRLKIAIGLKQKQIFQDVIDDVLSNLDETEYNDILRQVIVSRKKSIKGKTDYECDMKLLKSVAGRGFEISLIRKYMDFVED